MDELWTKVIKVTGAGGVVGFLIYIMLEHIFSNEIVKLFGSEKLFAITYFIIASLMLILAISILWPKKETSHKTTIQPKAKVVYRDKSTHHGDNNF